MKLRGLFFLRAPITWSTYFSQISVDSASTMTRIRGSVPLCLRSSLPSLPRAFSTSAAACFTSSSPRAAALSATRTFLRTWGRMVTSEASLDRVSFFSSITSITLREVRMPSPVVACLLKMMWPDCSPPRQLPVFAIFSYTYLSPTAVFS